MQQEDIFISYTHTDETTDNHILKFVNSLRTAGYAAVCDTILQERETSADFLKMMQRQLISARKVIVVLSRQYKEKADNTKGGTWTEFRYVSAHIDEEPNKYILITLDTNHKPDYSDVLPEAFYMRNVIDVELDNLLSSELINELADKPRHNVAPISSNPIKPITIGNETLSEDALSLLREMAKDTDGKLIRVNNYTKGMTLSTNNHAVIENAVGEEKKRWNEVLHELVDNAYITKNIETSVYVLTYKGYRIIS